MDKQMSKKSKIYIAFFALVLGGYVVYRIVSAATATPKDFEAARLRGAAISQNIVTLSDELKSELAQINELDKRGDYTEALTRTTEVASKSQEIRAKAVELSGELQIMTSALPKLRNEDSKQAVLDSVSNRLALISKLINYSDYIYQLLAILRDKFTGTWHSQAQVASLIEQVNSEVTAINAFNQSAISAMNRFDNANK